MQFWKSLNELSLQASPPLCPNMEQFYSLDIYGQYSTYIPYTCDLPHYTLHWPSTFTAQSPVGFLAAGELNSLYQRE